MSPVRFTGIFFHFTRYLTDHGCRDVRIDFGAPPEKREAAQAMLRKALVMGARIYFAYFEDQRSDEDDEGDG